MDLAKTVLGIELGSTRIKAVLIDEQHIPIASGSHEWQNRYEEGIWTYPLAEVHAGLQACFRDLRQDVKNQFGIELTETGAIGISGMMHGYLPFDEEGNQLAAFRTWRNTVTAEASRRLSALFDFNIPQRWSAAHLYQAILNGEDHVSKISYLTTLAGYIHYRLSGEKVMGIGEASGMFPVDSNTFGYDEGMLEKFEELTGINLRTILPKVLRAGDHAGFLSEEGARFLDPSGHLKAGIPLAPCEGDAGTGMAATDSVRVHTGNVSAGTSDFAMIVTDQKLGVHPEIDMVTTPDGFPVAMVHCNNCTSDINAWVSLFAEFASMMGIHTDKGELYTKLFEKALEGDPECGGLLSYNFLSGEHIAELDEGRPLFVRTPQSDFTLANFMKTHLYSSLAALKTGLDILRNTEGIQIEKLYGHGGFFKTPGVGSRILSAAIGAPVSVMETAGEGGPYGMALLAAYMIRKEEGESLADYLDNQVFKDAKSVTVTAEPEETEGFSRFLERWQKGLSVERKAVELL
jgi:sugar (pentulose or hexulose) kinase